MDPEIQKQIEEAVGQSWETLKNRYPRTMSIMLERFGNIPEIIIKSLAEDVEFQALLADTEKAIEAANIAKVIADVAFRVVEKVLMLL